MPARPPDLIYILNYMWTVANFIIKGRTAAGCAPLHYSN